MGPLPLVTQPPPLLLKLTAAAASAAAAAAAIAAAAEAHRLVQQPGVSRPRPLLDDDYYPTTRPALYGELGVNIVQEALIAAASFELYERPASRAVAVG